MLLSMRNKLCWLLLVEMVCSRGGVWLMVLACGRWDRARVWLGCSGYTSIRS